MVRVALVGPLSGTFAWVGQSLMRGAAAALSLDSDATLVPFDTAEWSSDLACFAEKIAVRDDILAVVGPTFSREVEAMGPVLSRACVPFVLPLATKPELGEQGWPCFFRIVATDTARGTLTGKFILDFLGSIRPAVASERSQSAQRAAGRVADALEQQGTRPHVAPVVDRGTDEVGVVAAAIKAADSDSTFYAGEYREASLLHRELADGGYSGTFVADEGALTREFVAACAPGHAEGVFSVGPGSPSAALSHVDGLALDSIHVAFIAEGYQCGGLLSEAIRAVGTDRSAVTAYLRTFDGRVAGRPIRFSATGENTHETFYIYRVQSGEWKFFADVSNDSVARIDERVVTSTREERSV